MSDNLPENSDKKKQISKEKGFSLNTMYRKFRASRFARKQNKMIKKGVKGLGQEAVETKEMAQSFYKLLSSKLNLSGRKEPPTEEEVKAAIEQLKDIGRFSVFTTISIIPGGGFSLIGLEVLAKKLGVKNFTFLPSAFREEKDKKDKKK